MRYAGLMVLITVLLGVNNAKADSGDAEAKVRHAVDELNYFNFDQAYILFDSIVSEAPATSDLWQRAMLGKAVGAHQMTPCTRQHIDEAASLYRLLADMCPYGKYTPRALMNLGRIDEVVDYYVDGKPENVDLVKARGWYLKVIERWPQQSVAGEATLRVAGTYIQTYKDDQVRQGIKVLQDWLKVHPKDELASAMWEYLGDTYFSPLGDYEHSLASYRKADEIGWLAPSQKGPIFWRMATLADRYLHDQPTAIRYYTKVITETPSSGKAYEAQLALKRLGAPVPEIKVFAGQKSTPAIAPSSP